MTLKPTNSIPRLLTVEETAEILNESTKTTRRRIKSGELPHIRNGRHIRILPDLIRYPLSRSGAANNPHLSPAKLPNVSQEKKSWRESP